MGASGWSYVTAYQGDAAKSLQELRERVFRDKEYHWADGLGDDEPRPETIEGIWASEEMRQSGTHSILDVSRVVETTTPPSWENRGEDLGTIRPMAAERVIRYFGTSKPSRARFEELAGGLDPASEDFITEVQMGDTGLYVLLYDEGSATEIGFWGFSGDLAPCLADNGAMREVKPPSRPGLERRVFLAGSIEMGTAGQWQQRVASAVSDVRGLVVLNPRRDDWDDSWAQRASNGQFRGQVSWELEMLEAADIVVMYLDPATRSPVSLLELGLHARSGKLLVCCPDGFWRKGNVEVVCQRYRVPLFDALDDLIAALRGRLAQA